jgi:hypothetical protein
MLFRHATSDERRALSLAIVYGFDNLKKNFKNWNNKQIIEALAKKQKNYKPVQGWGLKYDLARLYNGLKIDFSNLL